MNQPEDAPSKRISELLGKLQAQPDAAQITLQGRATSRSETNLHLAVSSGIVAIPIDEIEDVVPLSTTTDPTLVSVLVKDASKVRHLLKVQSTMGAAEGSGSQAAGTQVARERGLGGSSGLGSDTATPGWTDTVTISGGRLDDTADMIPTSTKDDEWV